MSQKIRILLIDDYSLFRESLARFLETVTDFQVAGSFATLAEAHAALDRERADIVLLDCDHGDEQGAALVQSAVETGLGKRVLLVTAGMSDIDTVRMLKFGVSGIFMKHSPPAQLVDAIRKAARGDIWLDSKAVRALVAGAIAGETVVPPQTATLNSRERAVLSELFEGHTNKEIAGKLQISENAVKWVLQHLFEKTGARVRSQLVRIVLERYGKDWLTSDSARQ
jgi:two-component system nitrate/nitrite response regulator NarL